MTYRVILVEAGRRSGFGLRCVCGLLKNIMVLWYTNGSFCSRCWGSVSARLVFWISVSASLVFVFEFVRSVSWSLVSVFGSVFCASVFFIFVVWVRMLVFCFLKFWFLFLMFCELVFGFPFLMFSLHYDAKTGVVNYKRFGRSLNGRSLRCISGLPSGV